MIHLGGVDVMRAVWFWSRARQSVEEGDAPGHKRLPIINGPWQHPDYEAKWNTIKQLINKAKRVAENNGFRVSAAMIETVQPHICMPWTAGLQDEAIVYIVLNAPYPKFLLYEDVAVVAPVPGQIWAVGSNNQNRTMANFGDWEAVYLALTLKKEAIEE